MIRVHHLKPAPGSRKDPKRLGRGRRAGGGKTAGRGTKGTGARGRVRPGFEGGQMPLARRIPSKKGFDAPGRMEYSPVNVERLVVFPSGSVVGPEELVARGLAKKGMPVKILGRGDLDRPLTVRAHAFSASASVKILAAGGRVEVV